MKIFLSGHYSNDFLKEIAGNLIFDGLSKVYQVEMSATLNGGGNSDETAEAMRVFLSSNNNNASYSGVRYLYICLYPILKGRPWLYEAFNYYAEKVPDNDLKRDLMNIYLAGGISGNLRDFWSKVMKVYQSSPNRNDEVIGLMKSFLDSSETSDMKLYLAGDNNKKKILRETLFSSDAFFMGENALATINVLESYYYLRKNEEFMTIVRHFGSFLLDSGAFTFMQGSHQGKVDWDKYVEDYAAFINRFNVKLFFELDIDSIVGLAEVERLRFKLEKLTGKKPIPVWHKNRGKDYFIKMCENYPYVAIGGIVTKEIPRKLYEQGFPWFIKTAHEHGAKIHGLGYTTVANLKKYRFDSVDSTAWLYGNRGGYLYKFNPKTGLMEQINGSGKCRLKSREGAVNNFNEWVKFSAYAEKNL